MAGRAAAVRPVADGVRAVPALAAGWHLAAGPDGLAGPGGRGRADHLGCVHRFHSRPGPPARGRGAEKGDLQAEPPGGIDTEPDDHGLGRSRGGFTTKVHLACEQGQKPLSILITAGQRGDSPQFQPVLERIRVPRPGRGRPAPAPGGSWPTRPTAPAATAPTCAVAGSGAPSRTRPTRSATARTRAAPAAARPPSTPNATRTGTRSSAASAGSSATGPSPPATTSSPSATKPPSTSLQSTSGSAPTYETRPR